MGTHPIFESDFDCLTDLNKNKKHEPLTTTKHHCRAAEVARGHLAAIGRRAKQSRAYETPAAAQATRPTSPSGGCSEQDGHGWQWRKRIERSGSGQRTTTQATCGKT